MTLTKRLYNEMKETEMKKLKYIHVIKIANEVSEHPVTAAIYGLPFERLGYVFYVRILNVL
jgi:hypothetical protein